MKYFQTVILLSFCLITISCEGDFRQRAIGDNIEITVVMDSTLHEGETAQAIRDIFQQVLTTVPDRPYLYDLNFRDFSTNDELEQLKKHKNIIFAGPLGDETYVSEFIRQILSDDIEQRVQAGESFAFPLENQWYRDQWTLVLTSTSDNDLAEKLLTIENDLVRSAVNTELERWNEYVFDEHEQTEISDSLWANHGWRVRMQNDYVQTVDTTNFVMFNRYLPENNRILWAWWKEGVTSVDDIDSNWIRTTRDSLSQIYLRGQRESSYVETDDNRDFVTQRLNRNDRITGWETLGSWSMTNDAMAGPFVNFTYYDPMTHRLYMIEYWQFAPDVSKRRFVFQFRTMGRSFESDSTFTSSMSNGDQLTDLQ